MDKLLEFFNGFLQKPLAAWTLMDIGTFGGALFVGLIALLFIGYIFLAIISE
jgi:hypothetical protein